ncbi:MAG: pilus assembly PilX N-terminal domain-containing protein [Pseudomonadota bacterium]
MRETSLRHSQRGVALIVALLFLLIVTIISVNATRNSAISLRTSGNMQDEHNSLQSAEAAIYAALALSTTSDDPFGLQQTVNPFSGVSSDPLANVKDANAVSATVRLRGTDDACPRPRFDRGGFSEGTFACDYYQVDATHDLTRRARTQVSMGVVKTVFGPG